MKLSRAQLLLAPLVLLAACEDEAAEPVDTTETGGEAAGEVLGGTISDEMIHLEQLTSTSPPAERPITAPGGVSSQSSDASDPSAPTEEAEAPSDAPASDPSTQE